MREMKIAPARRLGLSMRTADAVDYQETRDALATDWANFLTTALPGVAWAAIPNIGQAVAGWLETWGIDGLLLTGGESIGKAPRRDETETAILAYALERQLPVFGVCRGLQFMQANMGGKVVELDTAQHVATRHQVDVVFDFNGGARAGDQLVVNSYHNEGVRSEMLMPGIQSLACATDGTVEAFCVTERRWLATMWHPEREPVANEHDIAIVRTHYGWSM